MGAYSSFNILNKLNCLNLKIYIHWQHKIYLTISILNYLTIFSPADKMYSTFNNTSATPLLSIDHNI